MGDEDSFAGRGRDRRKKSMEVRLRMSFWISGVGKVQGEYGI